MEINSFFGDSKDITPEVVKKKAGDLRSNIDDIISKGIPWAQGTISPGLSSASGFLPPLLISPIRKGLSDGDIDSPKKERYGQYEFEDWLGQKITSKGLIPLETKDRFNESRDLPKNKADLQSSPYSMRDSYLLFNDNSTDYFRHGLQILNDLNPLENPVNGSSNARLGQFKGTPSEKSDPVMFGFEIIIDDLSSPLLNGSVQDFLNNYAGIEEIGSKIPVYEDFKQQFIKFFKTKATVRIDQSEDFISNSESSAYPNSENSKSLRMNGKKAYMSYYINKIGGLANLTESNTTDTKKYLVDYRKDVITLDFLEDVSLSVGTLAHLYKLLYWSKPSGKTLVPENLLRFNCDIIVSECRNFNRVKKGIENGDLEVVKDNLSRYVYSLKECQFFFNNMPHDDSIDLGNIKTHESTSITFDYKYATSKFEKFMPSGDMGKYIGYDGGAIWKVGNPGARSTIGTQSTSNSDTSLPRFFTKGGNKFGENGVDNEIVTNIFGTKSVPTFEEGSVKSIKDSIKDKTGEKLKDIKDNKSVINALTKGKSLSELTAKAQPALKNYVERLKDKTIKSAKRELATLVNGRVNLLSRTLNKLAIGFVGRKGISPPQNVYTDKGGDVATAFGNLKDRFFYDIRNELTDFTGDSLSSFLNNSVLKKK